MNFRCRQLAPTPNVNDFLIESVKEAWNQGMLDSLLNENLDKSDCPYDFHNDVVRWVAWQGGMFEIKHIRAEFPDRIEIVLNRLRPKLGSIKVLEVVGELCLTL